MLGAAIILGIILFGVLPLFYFVAWRQSENFKRDYHDYELLVDDLPKIKEKVTWQADRWPMFARPVLFNEVDHTAQVHFSHVHKAMDEVNTIVPEIEKISLPGYSKRVPPVIDLPENIRRIRTGNDLRSRVNRFAFSVIDILNALNNINSASQDSIAAKKKVVSSLEGLILRLGTSQGKAKTYEWAANQIDHIYWTLQTTQRCCDTARDRLKLASGDGLEYAIAYIYIEVGKASLDYFDLFTRGLDEAKRYELDDFAKRLKKSDTHLTTILENEELSTLQINDLSNWRKLRQTDEQVKQFPAKLADAATNLEIFKGERQQFEALEEKLKSEDLDGEIEGAIKIEEECTYYWYSFQEKPKTWQSVLAQSRPPAEILIQVRSYQISNLFPILKNPGIKQSQLPNIIDRIKATLSRIDISKQDLQNLQEELNRHKEARKQVEALLAVPGPVYSIISELLLIIKDTSPTIMDDSQTIILLHKGYVNKKEKVRGANFPELLVNVYQLIDYGKVQIETHRALLIKLETDCTQSARQMRNDLTDITELMSITPAVEPEICKQLERLEKAGYPILDNFHPSAGYNSLNTSYETMRAWLLETVRYLDPARTLHQAFKEARNEAVTQLRATQSQINQQSYSLQYKWGWVKSAMAPVIESIQSRLDKELKNWNRHEGRKWAEMYQRDAIAYCEKTIARCDEILSSLNDEIADISKEQKRLLEKEKAIRKIAEKNMYNISPNEITNVLQLCNIAHSAETHEMVKITLKRAEQIVTNVASYQERQQAQTIINTGGGTYVGGNLNTGGGDFIGRDKNR